MTKTVLFNGHLRFTDEELKARPISDDELRQNIIDEAIDLVRQLKARHDEKTLNDEEEDGVCIVVDLIHPVHLFLIDGWGPDKERYIYDDYRYRLVSTHDRGCYCLATVFRYFASPDWKAFVDAIDFSSVEFDQPWVERVPNPDMSWA